MECNVAVKRDSNSIIERRIIESNGNDIFDTDIVYEIPLYQRAYAWEEKHIIQLVEDINDISKSEKYYIGTLIVSEHDGKFEVIDGQQRLTTLFLLLNCLDFKEVKKTLVFACRKKSNYSLSKIKELLVDERSKFDLNEIEQNILNGIKILKKIINNPYFDKETFIKKLSKVVIYRIEVPKHTDLNRYFEIMNTRGEQLEQHDILKAVLMSYLRKNNDKEIFAQIWDACSDMDGYVQMHFKSRGNYIRNNLFGSKWDQTPPIKWKDYAELSNFSEQTSSGKTINDIINGNIDFDAEIELTDDDVRVRFESVIEFPFFLLHALKVFIKSQGIQHKNSEKKLIDELLDDKKLLDNFDRVIDFGVYRDRSVKEHPDTFAKDFIIHLLRTRFLFDTYIIKREFLSDNNDGDWSLKSLNTSGGRSQKKPYYTKTKFGRNNEIANKNIIMIQSALRVSYTSPKVMHWITNLLLWLSENAPKLENMISQYDYVTESIAIDAVKQNFFELPECDNDTYRLGVNTPHIVFNYLDYLIWKKDPDNDNFKNFKFEFRNSVEHWYPQNPSEGMFDKWTDGGVDRFGNLCIIQRTVNSRFSNMAPEAKKTSFVDTIKKGSLKLRLMSALTTSNDKSASQNWKDELCAKHEAEMIDMLKRACGIY